MTKQRDLIADVKALGAKFVREGGSHLVYKSKSGKMFTIPRHREIGEALAKKIRKQAQQ